MSAETPARYASPAAGADGSPVGVIGAGLLGSAIVARFVDAGNRVVVHDRDPSRERAVSGSGATWLADPAEMFRQCAIVFLSLPTSRESARVIEDAGGALRAGHLIADTTTGAPDEVVALAESLAARGVRYVDACVSGSSAQAREGEALVLAGGSDEDLGRVRPLLRAFAREVIHTGPAGSGSRMKLVTNLVLGLNRAALAEGLAFARALGVAPADAWRVLCASAAYSRVMDTKGEKMVHRDFRPQAKLSQHLKDVRLILESAGESQTPLPLSELHARLLESVERAGFGDEDNSAVLRAYDDAPSAGRRGETRP